MRRGSTVILLAWWLLSPGFVAHADAAPIPACVANDIIAGDPGCPASGSCTITKVFTVFDGCVLDFGTRDVTISVSGELRVGTASVTLRAGKFAVAPGGLVEGNTTAVGGSFTVEATRDIEVLKGDETGTIRMSGEGQGGSILLDAGGNITIQGQLHAHNRTVGTAVGGDITLRAGGDIVTTSGSEIDPHGGLQAFGGSLWMVADGLIDIGNPIDITGGDGGSISISAGDKVTVRNKLNATGQGDAGSGGDIDIVAGKDVNIAGQIQSRGTGSATGSGGGDGGEVFISASLGDITVSNEISVQSGAPDGGGGGIELFARGRIDVQPTGLLIASGNGFESDGGEVFLDAGIDIMVNGLVEAAGGDSGGDIGIEAGRDILVNKPIRARSTNQGSFGGSVTIQAGILTSGNFTLTDTIDASGPGCDLWGSCSLGGDVDVTACDLTVERLGVIGVSAPGLEGNGGAVFIIARDQMRILGSLDARGAGGPMDGSNTMVYPTGIPPIVTGSVLPAPVNMPRNMCTGYPGDPPLCLSPCPACGNRVTEFPETCDDTTGTPVSCDGCSRFCQLEDCNGANRCTADSCDPDLGCINALRPNGTPCGDGTICNGEEICIGGACLAGQPLHCGDTNPCTLDSCDPVTGCHNDPLTGEPCSDDNLCTRIDACQGGTCRGSNPVICTALDQCHDAGLCEPGTGICSNPPPKANGTPCSDGLYCTVDSCQAGTCVSAARDCGDDNDCTTGFCDESGDTCVQEPVALCCGNGIVEEGEECDEGTENSDEPNATCRTDCRVSRCGNGVLDDLLGERCDLGEANSDEPNASCRTDCLKQRCGDGVVDDVSGEQCDDGDTGPDDGCSSRCFVDPPPTASLIPGRGSTTTDCIIEWKMNDVALDKKGRPSPGQSCVDGDLACDHDGAVNGQCIFHVWLCSHNTDPNLPLCQTGTGPNGKGVVIVVQVKKPNLSRALRVPVDGETRAQLLRAGAAASVGNGHDVCGPRLSIRVPHKALGGKGVTSLSVRATTSLNVKDTDVLRLTCWP